MDELKKIKKLYGEKMAHLCRELFSSILEESGMLSLVLENNFNPDRQIYFDIIENNVKDEFKSYIYNLLDVQKEEKNSYNKNPEELLSEVDYDLYKCETVEDLSRFKSYYKSNELLCTFRDGGDGRGRLKTNHIFFAVKKDVNKIQRGDKPRREDDYGVSVISIQISKDKNWLSIKNRYNHTVNNPDATFSNNLDNIIPGLTESFNQTYGLEIDKTIVENFELPKYTKASDGKFYRYNMEINNKYYCPNNIIIENGEVSKFDKSTTRIIDHFIINKAGDAPSITNLNDGENDPFIDTIGELRKVLEEKKKTEDGKEFLEITLIPKDEEKSNIVIQVDESNSIIGYENANITEIGHGFLKHSENLKTLNLPNLERVGYDFLFSNKELEVLNLTSLEQAGPKFLMNNKKLNKLDLPKLKKLGDAFCANNQQLKALSLPKLEQVGHLFFQRNEILEEIDLPKLKLIGIDFFTSNKNIKRLDLPSLEQAGDNFLRENVKLEELNSSNLQKTGDNFLKNNLKLKILNVPSLEQVGNKFLRENGSLETLDLPNLKKVGNEFLYLNDKIKKLDLPKLEQVGNEFLNYSENLENLNSPNLKIVGSGFLLYGRKLKNLNLPSLEQVGDGFLAYNEILKTLNVPKLKKIEEDFLFYNKPLADKIKSQIQERQGDIR